MTMKMSQEAAKSDVKVNENPIKEEKKVMKETKNNAKVNENTIIMDAKPETKAKTKALNAKKTKKGGDTAKKPAKRASTTRKGGKKMDHNEKLVKIMKDAAKKDKDLDFIERSNGVTFQLKRGGDNIMCVRKADVIAYRPIGIFPKKLMLKAPWFKKFGKDENGEHNELYTHIVHLRKTIDEAVFKDMMVRAIKDKKTVAEHKKATKAVVKARSSKKTERQKILDLEASIKRQKEQLKGLKAAKAKVAKKKTPAKKKTVLRKAAKKNTAAVNKVAASIA